MARIGMCQMFPVVVVAMLATCCAAQTLSLDDVRTDYTNGEYRAVVTKTGRLFSSSLQEPLPSEKYELLMMRGESQLQLKDRLGAIQSFKSATKCAADVNQLSLAKANALIIERSSMGKYTPRAGTGVDPIDIVPMESRRQAMAAFEAELWSQNKSQIDRALQATTLPPIEKVFVPLSNMFFLETAAKGQADETGKVMRDLGQRTHNLMQTEISRYARIIDQLAQAANSSSGNWGDTRRGLISTERDQVKDATVYLAKLRDRATEYRGLASKLGGNEQKWDGLVLDANDTLSAAEALANDDR